MNFFEKAQARARALEILGLGGHPSPDEVRAAYKKKVFEKHPDQGGGSSEEFAEVSAAYAILKDDNGFSSADLIRPNPVETGDTTFENRPSGDNIEKSEVTTERKTRIKPRRLRTGMSSRICKLGQSEALECRMLLDELPYMAEPDPDELSLRASILDIIKDTGTPHVPHTNHLPYAIRQSGRRISYMVRETIAEGANRVAVPTGVFSDNKKAAPIIVRFKSPKDGAGTHVVSAATLADSFPGARSVRIHFGLEDWPASAVEATAVSA